MNRILTTLALALCACTSQQRAETARAHAVFACEVAALAPHIPDAIDAAELARDVVTGRVELPLALVRLGASLDQVNNVVGAFNSCFAGPAPAQPLPIEAAPAAYGNKVL